MTLQPDDFFAAVEERQLSESDSLRALIVGDRTQREEPAMPRKGEKASPKTRVKKTCACGYVTDWPPAFARHVQACQPKGGPEMLGHKLIKSGSFDDDGSNRPDLGADPCEIVSERLEAITADPVTADDDPVIDVGTRLEEACRTAFDRETMVRTHTFELPAEFDGRLHDLIEDGISVRLVESDRQELIDTHIRLIGAMVAGSSIPLTTQTAIQNEVDRVRELVKGGAR